MSTIINYMLEANAGLLLFGTVYFLMLRNETSFRFQRGYLLTAAIASLLFPLLKWRVGSEFAVASETVKLLPMLSLSNETETVAEQMSLIDWMWWVYAVIAAALLILHVTQIVRLIRQSQTGVTETVGNSKVILTSNTGSSYSFFHLIFIADKDQLSETERQRIIEHEMIHAKLGHSFDSVLFSVLTCMFWYNPMVWFLKRTMAIVHEYQVDEKMLSSCPIDEYSEMVARSALRGMGLNMVHAFNESFILKRINMMQSIKHKVNNWKIVASLFTVVLFFTIAACEQQDALTVANNSTMALEVPDQVKARVEEIKKSNENAKLEILLLNAEGQAALNKISADKIKQMDLIKVPAGDGTQETYIIIELGDAERKMLSTAQASGEVFTVVDESASPASGMPAFFEELSGIIKYPESMQGKVKGVVYVEFVVDENGHLSDQRVVKGLHPDADAEVIRAMQLVKDWTPGKQNGKAVKQRMVLPVSFRL